MLSEDRLTQALKPRAVQYFASVDSTNDVALKWIREGAAAGAVVIADEQLRGRGRKGRTWHTPPGVAIACSVVMNPPVAMLNRVSMVGALAISDLIMGYEINHVGIKWPNDVLIAGRKVSGILPEAEWSGTGARRRRPVEPAARSPYTRR